MSDERPTRLVVTEVRCAACDQLFGRRYGRALTLFGVEPRVDPKDPRYLRVVCPSCKKRIRLEVAA